MSIREDKSFMGIWQLHGMSTVLDTPIYSVYPKLGNGSVRKDLNRLLLPASESDKDPIIILWSSNRDDMTSEHWVPNHFVPLIPILNDDESTGDYITEEEKSLPKGDDRNNFEKDINDITIYVNENENGEYNVALDNTTGKDKKANVIDNACKMDEISSPESGFEKSQETPAETHNKNEAEISDKQELKHMMMETEGKAPTECEISVRCETVGAEMKCDQGLEIERDAKAPMESERNETLIASDKKQIESENNQTPKESIQRQ
ncbi:hypothetical protein DPMN_083531 [Dreissena polymorpha]|uniref:Uncharacterized protein n=1 Tax=Dreissena polymorpha TaxID=45954 RepID=A0A9D4BJX9_DREPO|nr:hypothetical protein DPMN_083531 [Dreissena polymorpha]